MLSYLLIIGTTLALMEIADLMDSTSANPFGRAGTAQFVQDFAEIQARRRSSEE
jgi:hypothetical protein